MTSKIIFSDNYSKPLFPINFQSISWKTESLATNNKYKITEDDILLKRSIRPRHHVPKSAQTRGREVSPTKWNKKQYSGEIVIYGTTEKGIKHTLELTFDRGELVEIREC